VRLLNTRVRALSAGAAIAVFALAVFSPAIGSASAHDQVTNTTPIGGQHLLTPPTEVTIGFTQPLLDMGAAVLVVDESGADWVTDSPRLDGASVHQALQPNLAAGNYQVRWRVVSQDGHPISGSFDFAVGAQVPDHKFTPAQSNTATAPATEPGQPAASGALPLPVTAAIGAGVGLVVFAGILLIRRRFSVKKTQKRDLK
jgi:methionine-rich copper-binding protein CopC